MLPASPRTASGCKRGDVFQKFMTRLLRHPEVKPLLSDEHLSVDGTLIAAWASQKSFRPHDGSGGDGSDFHGQRRKNDAHASTTDPASRLYRKAAGREAKLCYMGHVIMENRHGLVVGGTMSEANGTAGRARSEALLWARRKAAGSRWARTKPMTAPSTWRKTRAKPRPASGGGVRSTAAPRGT